MIETAGLILALVGIAFAFEAPRNAFLKLIRAGKEHKSPALSGNAAPSPINAQAIASPISGATQSGRHPFFIDEPSSNLATALETSEETGRPVFLVIYDENHPTMSKLYYSLGCFMDYFATKRLVQDHFVVALVASTDENAKNLVPPDDPLENCLWVVLSRDGNIIRREGIYANADEGLKRVRSVISSLSKA